MHGIIPEEEEQANLVRQQSAAQSLYYNSEMSLEKGMNQYNSEIAVRELNEKVRQLQYENGNLKNLKEIYESQISSYQKETGTFGGSDRHSISSDLTKHYQFSISQLKEQLHEKDLIIENQRKNINSLEVQVSCLDSDEKVSLMQDKYERKLEKREQQIFELESQLNKSNSDRIDIVKQIELMKR